MLNPRALCRRHLIGEHGELHKHLHCWRKKYSIAGRIATNSIEPMAYAARHNALENEMRRRSMSPNSPLSQPDFSYLPMEQQTAKVSIRLAVQLLIGRCRECAERMVRIVDRGQCVQCGYCCRVSSCGFGQWDPIRRQCVFLADSGLCVKYDEIVAIEKKAKYMHPMMGSGCSSQIFNESRDAKLRELASKGGDGMT